mgnify:CR=1 FL=1
MKKSYDVDINKTVVSTKRFLNFHDVQKHWSKTKNERYDVHLMITLYVIFRMADKSYRRFRRLLESCPPAALEIKKAPCFTALSASRGCPF